MALETDDAPRVAAASEGIWSGSYRLLTIGLALTVAGAAFESLAVATILPATTKDLGGLALYGWAFSAFMLTNLMGIIIAGDEADRRGPARPFVLGVALFALGLLVAGSAPSMIVVIVGRLVQGLGAGVISAVAYVAIGRGYPEAAKPRMLAVISSAWVVPGLVGPAIAGLVADSLGWRWVFLGLAPLCPLAGMLALPALRRLGDGSSAPRDWGRVGTSARLAAGAGLCIAGLGQRVLPIATALLVAGVALGLPALRRLLPAGTLRGVRGLPAAVAVMGLLSLAFFGVDAFVPLTLIAVRGQSAAFAGLALTTATVCWTTGSWLQERLAPRRRHRLLVVVGLTLMAAASAGVTTLLLPAVPVLLAPAIWAVGGLGIGLAYSTLALLALEAAPPGEEGAATSSLQLASVLGGALGTGVGGAIIAFAGSGAVRWGIGGHYLLMIGVIGLAVLTATRLAAA